MTQPNLNRTLGVPAAVFLGLGSIFGTGVFVSIGIAAGFAGHQVMAAIAVAALLATCNALSSAQLAASHPVSGGTYEYGYRLVHPAAGFTAGLLFMLAKSASAATAALGIIGYSLTLFGMEAGAVRPVLALIVTGVVTGLVLSGLRRSSIVNTVIVLLTLAALTAFITVAAASPAQSSAPNPNPAHRDFLYACALMFVAFTGYGRIATLGEEVRAPKRTIPKAIIITLFLSASVYLLTAWAGLRLIGADGLSSAIAQNAAPLEIAAQASAIPGLRYVVAGGAIIAMLGVLLNLVLGLSRVALAMARRGDLPSALAKVSSKGNPNVAIICVGAFIGALTLIGNVETTWAFSALTVLCYYTITNISALRQPASERLYPRIVSVAGLLGCLGLAMFIPASIWLAGIVVVAIGFGVRGVLKRV